MSGQCILNALGSCPGQGCVRCDPETPALASCRFQPKNARDTESRSFAATLGHDVTDEPGRKLWSCGIACPKIGALGQFLTPLGFPTLLPSGVCRRDAGSSPCCSCPMLRVPLLGFPGWPVRGCATFSSKSRVFTRGLPRRGASCGLTSAVSALAARAAKPLHDVKATVHLCRLFSSLKGGKRIPEPLLRLLSVAPPELEWGWLINMIHCCLLAVRARVKLLVPAGLALLTGGLMHFALGNSDTQHHMLALPHK